MTLECCCVVVLLNGDDSTKQLCCIFTSITESLRLVLGENTLDWRPLVWKCSHSCLLPPVGALNSDFLFMITKFRL